MTLFSLLFDGYVVVNVAVSLLLQPWRTLCGFPPTTDTVTLRIPNGAWRPDTVITDYEGTEMFVLLDQTQEMRSYEAIFGDLEGRRLVCIKRHLIQAFWRDGYYLCTYKPNYQGQRPLQERDVDNKKVYPFSYLQVNPVKGRFFYRYFDNQEGLGPPRMRAMNPWLGFMVVCCTPMIRCGKWTASFKRRSQHVPTIHVDQWRNCVDVGPGNDLLAALCMAYIFDRYQCQPLVTVFGNDEDDLEHDDASIGSDEERQQPYKDDDNNDNNQEVELTNMPDNIGSYRDEDPEYQDGAVDEPPYYDEKGGGEPYYDENNNTAGEYYESDGNYNDVNQEDAYDDRGFDEGDDHYDDGAVFADGNREEDLLEGEYHHHHAQETASVSTSASGKPEIV